MRWLVLGCALAACGRGGFDLQTIVDGPPGDETADDAPPDGVPDAPPATNRVFATSEAFSGNLGGLAGADAKCATAAMAAGLPGTFIALLSTSTVDARDRIAGSRGWVRVDGAPVADQPASMFSGVVFNPIDIDEGGVRIGDTADSWTGSTQLGVVAGATCMDWTVTTGSGQIGYSHYGPPQGFAFSAFGCPGPYHLYCFEVGRTTPVAPSPGAARYAFLSNPRTSAGIAALDARCQQDANAASLPGTYLAAVATTTTTIASRFTGTDWQRPDGTPVSVAGTVLFDTTKDPLSFIHQKADGSYVMNPLVFTGTNSPTAVGTMAQTCNNWSDLTTAAMTGGGGRPGLLHNGYLWGNQSIACSSLVAGVICLQQ